MRQGKAVPGAGATVPDLVELRPAHARLLGRGVAKPGVPDRRPDHAHDAEHEKGRPPSVADLNRDDQQRRDGSANLARHQQHAGHARALRRREPPRDDDGGVRKRACFAGAEAEPGDQQQVVVRHRAGQRRERATTTARPASARGAARCDRPARRSESRTGNRTA